MAARVENAGRRMHILRRAVDRGAQGMWTMAYQVAHAEGISLAWASANLRALVADGLLERRPSQSAVVGRPQYLYKPTDKGRAACSASSAPTA